LNAGRLRSIRKFLDTKSSLIRGAAIPRPYKERDCDRERRLCKRWKSNSCKSRREPLAAKQEVSCWRSAPNSNHEIWTSSD
jgi:hypothetical protein